MIFTPTLIPNAFIIDTEARLDARGSFTRTFCRDAFRARGLDPSVHQCSTSFNARRGTLRGIHVQIAPHLETKLVRCTRGAVFDVMLDLPPDSPSYLQWVAVELTPASGRLVYVPEGVGHGFQTLADDTELSYQISAPHRPAHTRGIRWDDPAFAVRWPLDVSVISPRDRLLPDFDPALLEEDARTTA